MINYYDYLIILTILLIFHLFYVLGSCLSPVSPKTASGASTTGCHRLPNLASARGDKIIIFLRMPRLVATRISANLCITLSNTFTRHSHGSWKGSGQKEPKSLGWPLATTRRLGSRGGFDHGIRPDDARPGRYDTAFPRKQGRCRRGM